jgi:WD40 repeat protein
MFHAHADNVSALQISPDGRHLLSASKDKSVKLWDFATGQLLHTLSGHQDDIWGLAFAPDGRTMASAGDDGVVNAWDAASGALRWSAKFDKFKRSIAFSPDGQFLALADLNVIKLLDAATGSLIRRIPDNPVSFGTSIASLPDGLWLVAGAPGALVTWDPQIGQPVGQYQTWHPQSTHVIGGVAVDADDRWLVSAWQSTRRPGLWDVKGERWIATFSWSDEADEFPFFSVSKDGRRMAMTAIRSSASPVDKPNRWIKIFNAANGKLTRTIEGAGHIWKFVLSPDGEVVGAVQGWGPTGSLRFWDATSGAELREIKGVAGYNISLSPDGSRLAYSDIDPTYNSLECSKRGTCDLQWELVLLDVASGRRLWSTKVAITENATQIAISTTGKYLVTTSINAIPTVWDSVSGARLRRLEGNLGIPQSVMLTDDERRVVVGNNNGTSAVWDLVSGELLTNSVHASNGEWITITPEGFFAASDQGASLLHVARRFDVIGIEQLYQVLYRPDLVREKLACDPRGRVREAALQLDLSKMLSSGRAPSIRFISPRDGDRAASQRVHAHVEIVDNGGGIGRVEWRVHGTTVGIDAPSAYRSESPLHVTRELLLDEGDNDIEIIAYNSANLVASLPERANAIGPAPSNRIARRLFVLAAGINNYTNPDLQLKFAVPDAVALSDAFRKAAAGLYEDVSVTLLRDAEVTRTGLTGAFAKLAQQISPTDVFVLYAAAHGKTLDGRYYLIPQDSNLVTPSAIVEQGITQDQWQAWLATIPARKSVIMFDTCESSQFASDEPQVEIARDAAADRLVQATGRTIMTAASGDAFEGFREHGLFTYNLIEGLARADTNNNGTIELSELAAYVYSQVVMLSEREFKRRQRPRVRMSGPDYAFAARTVIFENDPSVPLPHEPTHVLLSNSDLFIHPSVGARRVRRIDTQVPVTVVRSEPSWSLVAREGKPIGYVRTSALFPLQ